MIDHLFIADETDYKSKTLILYHSFTEFLEYNNENGQEDNLVTYWDAGIGRGWGEALGRRFKNMRPYNEMIKSALLMSTEELVAKNSYKTQGLSRIHEREECFIF